MANIKTLKVNAAYGQEHIDTDNNYNNNNNNKQITMDLFLQIVQYTLTTAMQEVGETVFKQKIGIAMGDSWAPDICNIVLGWAEYKFIQKMAQF